MTNCEKPKRATTKNERREKEEKSMFSIVKSKEKEESLTESAISAITGRRDWFATYREEQETFYLADNQLMVIEGRGDIEVPLKLKVSSNRKY